MKCEQLARREGAETEEPEQAELALETQNVEPVTRRPTTSDPVVIQHNIGATREPFPFLARRARANAGPEGEVSRGVQGPREPGERSHHSQPNSRVPKSSSVPIRVEEGAELHLRQQRGIGSHELDRRGSTSATQPHERGCVGQYIWLAPRELDASAT